MYSNMGIQGGATKFPIHSCDFLDQIISFLNKFYCYYCHIKYDLWLYPHFYFFMNGVLFYDSNVYPAQLVKNYIEKSKKRVIMKMDDIIRQALL